MPKTNWGDDENTTINIRIFVLPMSDTEMFFPIKFTDIKLFPTHTTPTPFKLNGRFHTNVEVSF